MIAKFASISKNRRNSIEFASNLNTVTIKNVYS